jgi:light-regulated signal transduction histidine kinase (bacteriophytochrome)
MIESNATQVDLTNCDKEPIHIPGKIQSHGVLLALNRRDLLITHASNNTQQHFNLPAREVLNIPLRQFLESAGLSDPGFGLDTYLAVHEAGMGVSESGPIVTTQSGKPYHLILQYSQDSILLELEPVIDDKDSDVQDMMSSMLTKILGAKTLKETLAFCVEQVKNIIGYDRVMIYRFGEDGHGEVVAEGLNEGLESFYGLHYPASDIPKQARELYKKNLVRIIADVYSEDAQILAKDETTAATPLDLTDSVLRAVSPIHIQYLKNMGVDASFSVSLIANGELWGLIACHHYSPKLIDYRKRNSCKIIGQLLSTSLLFRENEENKEQRNDFNEHIVSMLSSIRKDWDIPSVLTNPELNLLSITEATGAALLFEDRIYTLGETPGEEDLVGIATWMKYYNKNQFFQTNNLTNEYADAFAYKEVASGLMSCAISRELNEYIFWFKKEIPKTVKWAGNPDKPVELNSDGLLSLSPRRSFEVYLQEVTGVSEPWNSNEIAGAMKLREELVHIINERANQVRKLNEQLKQAYDELDTFSFTISHDLKTPLASIKNYAEILLEEALESRSPSAPMLQKIIRGADKMNLLIKEVLSYSRIGRQHVRFERIDMKEMLQGIREDLLNSYKQSNPQISILKVPDIYGDYTMMYQVFSNIIGNAVKYSSQKKSPQVTIDAREDTDETTYIITDNGIGIDMKNGDQIFSLFKRMNNANNFEGTGVGLAIVKSILEKHQSRIWYESEPESGTVFYICLKKQKDGQ